MIKQIYLLCLPIIIFSCHNNLDKNSENNKQKSLSKLPQFSIIDTFIDSRDSIRYSLLTIGKQCWTCGIIKNKPNKRKLFRDNLYNWEAAVAACPTGFKIPNDSDWNELFQFVYDSIIMNASPNLLESFSANSTSRYNQLKCNECKNIQKNASLPFKLKLDSIISTWKECNFFTANQDERETKMAVMFLFLEQIGFCTSGSGFHYNKGLGKDDYSYYWSSSTNNYGDHKYISIYTGDYCRGCGYRFYMPYSNMYGFNLKCLKVK